MTGPLERDRSARREPGRRSAREEAPGRPGRAASASGSGTVHGRAKALRRDRLPASEGPVVAGHDLEAQGAAEADQGLEGVLVQAGQMEREGMDAAGGGRRLARPSHPCARSASRTARGEWSASGVTFTRRRVRPAVLPGSVREPA